MNKIEPYNIFCDGTSCFVAGIQTLTKQGYKKIEDVEITDELLTHTGAYQKIIDLQRKTYNGTLYDIQVKCRPYVITTTEEHPFYIREKIGNKMFKQPVWKKANELTMNDYFGMVITKEFTDSKLIGSIGDAYGSTSPTEVINGTEGGNSIGSIEWAYNRQKNYLKTGRFLSIHVMTNQPDYYYLQNEDKNEPEFFLDKKYAWFAPTSIISRNTDNIPVYNFQVETDNSYIVENVITHTCQSFS